MLSLKVKGFISKCYLIKVYQEEINNLKREEDEIVYQMSGVHGVDPSKEPTQPNPNHDYYWKLSNKLERVRTRMEVKQTQLDLTEIEVNEVLSKMDEITQEGIRLRYIEGKRLEYVADKTIMSPSGIRDKMYKTLEKVLN